MIKQVQLLLLLLSLTLFACSTKEESFPIQRAKAERYILYQAQGKWPELCQMLSPEELRRVESALRDKCARGIKGEVARNLQSTARQAEITSVRQRDGYFEVEIGSEMIWITPKGIALRPPS